VIDMDEPQRMMTTCDPALQVYRGCATHQGSFEQSRQSNIPSVTVKTIRSLGDTVATAEEDRGNDHIPRWFHQ
jgi:hypothetical protein